MELAGVVRQQAWKLGAVAPGAVLHFFLSGTSTPQDVTDLAGTTLGTTLTADSTGRFAAFVLRSVAYRITLKDSTGATIWGPEDNITQNISLTVGQGGTGATSFTDGGVLIGNGTGAIQATAAGTDLQLLTGVTGSDPTFQTTGITFASSRVQQIAFAAAPSPSADPYTIDRFEEGGFTPTITSTGGGTPTYTAANARHQRVGTRCHFSINLALATKGTLAAGNVRVGGLPFAAASGLMSYGYPIAVPVWQTTATSMVGIGGIIAPGASAIDLIYMSAAGTVGYTAALQVSDIAATFLIWLVGSYETA